MLERTFSSSFASDTRKAIDRGALLLDRWRAGCLRQSLRFLFLRVLWKTRWLRLAVQFAAAATAYLFLAIAIPHLLIVISPLVFGTLHLAASLRFVPRLIPNPGHKRLSTKMGALYLGFSVLFYGLLQVPTHFGLPQSAILVIGFWIFAAVLLHAARPQREVQRVVSGAIVALLSCLLILYPVQCFAALVLLHNWVGFLVWARLAMARNERLLAFAAGAVTAGISVVIWLGAADSWIFSERRLVLPAFDSEIFSPAVIGFSIVPSNDVTELIRLGVIFAFSQALHYFVWLKAIPDTCTASQVPLSWRQSLRSLRNDFSTWFVALTVLVGVGLVAGAMVFGIDQVLTVYFAIAAAHGYVELAGLCSIPTASKT